MMYTRSIGPSPGTWYAMLTASTVFAYLFGGVHQPAHPVETPAVGDALQFVFAGVFELEARAGHEVLHGLRHETSLGPASAATREAIATAMPGMSPPSSSISPVCRPART